MRNLLRTYGCRWLLRRQRDWRSTIGQRIEVRLNGRYVDSGVSMTVAADGKTLWLAKHHGASAARFEQADGFQVWCYTTSPIVLSEALGTIGEPMFW